jgi:hypothetical protein
MRFLTGFYSIITLPKQQKTWTQFKMDQNKAKMKLKITRSLHEFFNFTFHFEIWISFDFSLKE